MNSNPAQADGETITMKFSEIPCPVCNHKSYEVEFPDTLGEYPPVFGYKWTVDIRKSYRLVRCLRCTHMYASPRLEEIYAYYVDVVDNGYLNNAPLRIATAHHVLHHIRCLVPNGRLLDVGCSTGDFLSVAKEFYRAEGLELSFWASRIAKDSGLPIYNKNLSDMAKDVGPVYDVITMWGVIEHLEFPWEEMQHVHRLLKPGGILCFWTGDSSSLTYRILRGHWWYIMGQHIQYFTLRSVDHLMQRAGFELVEMRTYPYVRNFQSLGERFNSYRIFGKVINFIIGILQLKKRIIVLKIPGEMFGIYRASITPANDGTG